MKNIWVTQFINKFMLCAEELSLALMHQQRADERKTLEAACVIRNYTKTHTQKH